MFRQKKCLQLETRLSRARQVMSREDDENKAIRAKIDELRRLIMMQVRGTVGGAGVDEGTRRAG
jgi:hypothetical protein